MSKHKKMTHKEAVQHISNGGNGFTLKEMLQIHMKGSNDFRESVLAKLDTKVSKDTYWKMTGIFTTAFMALLAFVLNGGIN